MGARKVVAGPVGVTIAGQGAFGVDAPASPVYGAQPSDRHDDLPSALHFERVLVGNRLLDHRPPSHKHSQPELEERLDENPCAQPSRKGNETPKPVYPRAVAVLTTYSGSSRNLPLLRDFPHPELPVS